MSIPTYKIGQTIKLLLTPTQEQWEIIYPYQMLIAEAKIGRNTYQFENVVVDEVNQTILISADTSNWKSGDAQADIKITKDGENIYLPSGKQFIQFNLVNPIADERV